MIGRIRNKLTVRIVVAMLAVFVSLSFVLLAPHSTKADGNANRDAELKLIEQYVSQSDMGGYWVQTLDKDAARNAGISAETVALMKEIIAYQNAVMYQVFLTGVRDITQIDVNMAGYPLAKAYFNEPQPSGSGTSSGGVSGSSTDTGDTSSSQAGHPCGQVQRPVPNYTPRRHSHDGDGHEYFPNNGYHKTLPGAAGYAYGKDYTKARSYSSSLGVCPSPLFRNQGHVKSDTEYWIQYGEPNPEIPVNPLNWPYVGWPFYVNWWHENF